MSGQRQLGTWYQRDVHRLTWITPGVAHPHPITYPPKDSDESVVLSVAAKSPGVTWGHDGPSWSTYEDMLSALRVASFALGCMSGGRGWQGIALQFGWTPPADWSLREPGEDDNA